MTTLTSITRFTKRHLKTGYVFVPRKVTTADFETKVQLVPVWRFTLEAVRHRLKSIRLAIGDFRRGKSYGFPLCCRFRYAVDMAFDGYLARDPRRLAGCRWDGYIPCVRCAEERTQHGR